MLCDFGLRTIQTSLRNITHSMLDSPNDTVHEQLELVGREGEKSYEKNGEFYVSIPTSKEQTGEAVQIGDPQQFE